MKKIKVWALVCEMMNISSKNCGANSAHQIGEQDVVARVAGRTGEEPGKNRGEPGGGFEVKKR